MTDSGVTAEPMEFAAENKRAPLACARDLFKIYKEGEAETVALRGASFDLQEGEFVTLVGASGSGKSTLLWILAGLSLPSAGQMLVNGVDLAKMDEAKRSEIRSAHIGVVFQRGNLIPFLTARENLELAMRMQGRQPGVSRRARDLLGDLGLADRLGHYPRQLSGGEAQRVGIALALANDPRLLLGDEVTGELDSSTAMTVMDILMALHRDRNLTMLLVTHNPRVAEMANRQLTISDGVVTDQ